MTCAYTLVLDLDEDEYQHRADEVPTDIEDALKDFAVMSVTLVATPLPTQAAPPVLGAQTQNIQPQ